MSRINFCDEEEFGGQFALWQANCERSIRGRAGQRAMRELEAALVALPSKRLERDIFVQASGEVCALGALAVHRKIQSGLSTSEALAVCAHMDPSESQEHGEALGFPRLAAWQVVAKNDYESERWVTIMCEGPNPFGARAFVGYYRAGYYETFPMTPELRYQRVLAWVQSELR